MRPTRGFLSVLLLAFTASVIAPTQAWWAVAKLKVCPHCGYTTIQAAIAAAANSAAVLGAGGIYSTGSLTFKQSPVTDNSGGNCNPAVCPT